MDNNFAKGISFQTCLGLGSFGIVFAAQSETPNRHYAVKLVLKDGTLSKKEQLELDRESQLTRQLPGHRNIVRVHDVVEKWYTHGALEELWSPTLAETEDQHDRRATILAKAKRHGSLRVILFQMELCGNTLRHWLCDESTHELNPDELHHAQFNILRNFSEGIKFLHKNNIIHRDIKPENTMFSCSQTHHEYAFPLKVGDFGQCRLFCNKGTQLATLTSQVGTPDYRAPEVLCGKYGHQCDIYSFGLVAWEVAQLIPCTTRGAMFDALKNDQDYNRINEHSAFTGIKAAIISMTMRTTHERMRFMDDFQLSYNAPKPLMCDKMEPADLTACPAINLSVQVVDTFRVANVLASDEYLVKYKIDQLCGSLCVDVEIGKRLGFSPTEMLKYILDAWVSKNGDKATISALVEVMKGMELIAVCDHLSSVYGPATVVVFQAAPDAFVTPHVQMQNSHLRIAEPQQYQSMFPTQPSQQYLSEENRYPDSINRGEPMPDFEAKFLQWTAGIHRIRDNLFAHKLTMYWHNFPERGIDEQIVQVIIKAAGIPGVADIVLKREEPKLDGWWNGGAARWLWNKKENDTPKLLKVKMKVKKSTGKPLNKTLIKKCIESIPLCQCLDVKVTFGDMKH